MSGRYCPIDACDVCGMVPAVACHSLHEYAYRPPLELKPTVRRKRYPVLKTEDVSGKVSDLPRLKPKP